MVARSPGREYTFPVGFRQGGSGMNRGRRRSAAITLVLAGSASLAGCGSPVEQQDAYASLGDCLKDWNEAALCEPARDGRYAPSYHYGPAYYGTSGWSPFGSPRIQGSPNAMETRAVPAGSVAASPRSQLASRMGVSRGGFGSSSSSFHASGG